MKFRKLNPQVPAVVTLISVLSILSACNNSDKSEKTSTTDTAISTTTDTTTTGNKMTNDKMMDSTTRTTKNVAKKVGRVSVTLPPVDKTVKMEADKSGYYNYTETAPEYPGGQSSLVNYINNNIEYPQEAIDNNIEGTVNVQFAIDENGKVSNAKAIGTPLGYGLEEAAVKAVSGMPKWTPGQVKGKNVKAWYTLPVTFRME